MKKLIIIAALGCVGFTAKAQEITHHDRQMIYVDTIPNKYIISDDYTLRYYVPRPNDVLDTVYVYNHLRYVLHEVVSKEMDAAYGSEIIYWKGVYDGMQLILNRPYANLEDVFFVKMRTIKNHSK